MLLHSLHYLQHIYNCKLMLICTLYYRNIYYLAKTENNFKNCSSFQQKSWRIITFNTLSTSLHIKIIIYFIRCKIFLKNCKWFLLSLGCVIFYYTQYTIFYIHTSIYSYNFYYPTKIDAFLKRNLKHKNNYILLRQQKLKMTVRIFNKILKNYMF